MSESELTKAIAINPRKEEFEVMQRQCKTAVISGLLPDVYREGNGNVQLAKAVVVAMKGRELGIPMMQAFSQINVIKGKPAISAELMLALIYRAHPNAAINFVVLTNEACKIEAQRPGGKVTTFEFTMDDAKTAGLLGNPTWKKYPRAMLRSRAVSELARSLFPDAIMGCSYTPEELGGEMNMDGEMIAAPRDVNPSSEPPIETTAETVEHPPQEAQTQEPPKDVNPKKEPQNHAPGAQNSQKEDYTVTAKQVKRLFAIAYGNDWTNDTIKPAMEQMVNKDSTKDLLKSEYDFLCNFFEENGPSILQDGIDVEPLDKALGNDPWENASFRDDDQKEYQAPNFAPHGD